MPKVKVNEDRLEEFIIQVEEDYGVCRYIDPEYRPDCNEKNITCEDCFKQYLEVEECDDK